ncbi:MAG: HD domain-containing phosphohydrolase [Bdellovibrionota bacterium]
MSKSTWGDIPNWIHGATASLLEGLKTVDPVTYEHCCRVGELARKLARDSGLSEYEQKLAEYSGIFHDIGKMGIGQEIIAKPGRLEAKELDIMRTHPLLSEDILKPLAEQHIFFHHLLPAVRGHHERVDGTGYPDKILGDRIPLMARIILIVDTYDAMSETRAYRKGLPTDIVYSELRRCSGTQFDAQLVKIFLEAHPNWAKQPSDPQTMEYIRRKVAKAA